uniref:Attractin/MKLN-like beta-propeller domain-containing protein n=1 Tax=Percolomonas cosmopolitus TaxID=63605 RepID=A0A7S1PFU6_9EUKA
MSDNSPHTSSPGGRARSNSSIFNGVRKDSGRATVGNSTDNIIYGDMWIYNVRQNTWFEIEYEPDSLLPAPRYGHSAVYSKPLDAMYVLCGTLNMQEINEDFEDVDFDLGNNMEREQLRKEAHKTTLWRFDFSTNRWTRVVFPFWDFKRISIQNLVRSNFVMILRKDHGTGRENILICFGSEENEYSDERSFFTFDLKTQNRWIRHLTTGSIPSLRDGVQYVYSEQDDVLFVYGGMAKSTQFTPDNRVFALDIQAAQWQDVSSQFPQLRKRKPTQSTSKLRVQTGRTSSLSRSSSDANDHTADSQYPQDMEPRGYAGSCLLPRTSPVHPLQFYVNNGLGEDRAVLHTSFLFELNFTKSVAQEDIVPSPESLLLDLASLFHDRSRHYDLIFQFPFPLESIHAHSFVVNQSSVIARWITKSNCNKQGKVVVDIRENLDHHHFGLLVQMMYGVQVASDDWEDTGIMASVLQLPDIAHHCSLKLHSQSSHLMNEQPVCDRSSIIQNHLKKQMSSSPSSKMNSAATSSNTWVQVKTLDTHILHFHRALCEHRCPQFSQRYRILLSRLDKTVVQSIQDYIYGQKSRLPFTLSQDKKRIEHLLNLACASRLLHVKELEEECLCHLKRSVHNASIAHGILSVCSSSKIGELYVRTECSENAECWKDLIELCRVVGKAPAKSGTLSFAIAKVLVDSESRSWLMKGE